MAENDFQAPTPLTAPAPQRPRRETSTMGILGLCLFWVPLVGLVLGILSLATREKKTGFGIIAIILSVLAPLLFLLLPVMAAIALPKFSSVKEEAEMASCRSNMRSLATAMSMYYGTYNTYPASLSDLTHTGPNGEGIIMENALLLRCPQNNEPYRYSRSGYGQNLTYTATCPTGYSATPQAHGSVEDGIQSWQ
jgi:Tfp pilus assembly protein PilE